MALIPSQRPAAVRRPPALTIARAGLAAVILGTVLAVSVAEDRAAATWAETLPSGLKHVAHLLTLLGTSGYMFALAACVMAGAWWIGRRTLDGRIRAVMAGAVDRAALFIAAIAASGLAAQVLKHAVGRSRPVFGDASGAFSFHPFAFRNAVASFPSGHATSAFAAATILATIVPRARPFLFLLASAIGASRVAVGAHYPSDVVSGAALGMLVALVLVRVPLTSTAMAALRSGFGRLKGPSEALHQPWDVAVGRLLLKRRRWHLPLVAAALFAVATPPSDLFGSALAEHFKDGCAILIALGGLTLRGLVAGFGPGSDAQRSPDAPALLTTGLHALCRNPLYAGNILIVAGIALMHGNPWTVLLGTLVYVLPHLAMVRAEEEDMFRVFGAAFLDHRRRVPRWVPDLRRLGSVSQFTAFDTRRVLAMEYPVIGLTVIALAAAEFYEEFDGPATLGRTFELEALGALILAAAIVTGAVWFARKGDVTFGA